MRKSQLLGLLFGGLFCVAHADPSAATGASDNEPPKVIMVKSAATSSQKAPVASKKTIARTHKTGHKNQHHQAGKKATAKKSSKGKSSAKK